MDYQKRNPLTDSEKEFYVNLLQLCPPGMAVFTKIKLAELVKPTADPGSDKFYVDVKKILSYTVDFVVYDLNSNCTVAVLEFQPDGESNKEKEVLLNQCSLELKFKYFRLNTLVDLYKIDF
ncbi:DUF2726 domain-containing protein [Serratia sp. J2]|uniref:DUF2726 domain-containing protein n=1 Tax=Serratia sp. J2 TaxID=3386551 RepID=UPI0039174B08